jgi:hypothetical protein
MPGQAVVVRQAGGQPRQTIADRQGRFVFEDLGGGVWQVSSGAAVAVCRCWAANTAPPSATEQLLLVSPAAVQRGQRPIEELTTPILIGLVVAAAIAIPIAVHNAKKERPSGS